MSHPADSAPSVAGPAAFVVDGDAYPRVPYGAETDEPATSRCPTCGAAAGELHTPGCDVEECPLCQYPAFDCDCEYEELAEAR